MWPFSSDYQSIVDAKRAKRDEDLAAAVKYADIKYADNEGASHQDVYLRATASEIVKNIERREWTASQVVDAYIARAVTAQALTNCLTEVLFDDARKEAAALDKEFEATGQLRGPLHGVPVSFKDQYAIAGYDSTIGFTRWANKPKTFDADVVKQLRGAGAVVIAKTNVPQTMLAFECGNPLWGRTLNPHSAAFTCGGSSGGEAALLALDGAALGVGSDTAGSLRIPAAYCGIYSLKPTARRISGYGAASPTPGFTQIETTFGPMSRSVADLELAARLMIGVSDPISEVVPIPYRDVQIPSKLCFGYYTFDGLVKASPACQRAVLETVEALRKKGHECVEFKLPDPIGGLAAFSKLVSADGYKKLTSHLGPDPREQSLFITTLGPKIPSLVRALASWIIGHIVGDEIFAKLLGTSSTKSAFEFMESCIERQAYEKLFFEKVWDAQGFDGIIAPTQAMPAVPHGACSIISPIAIATIIYNVVDSPVGTVPVTHVDPSKDALTPEWSFTSDAPDHGSRSFEAQLYGGKQPMYDAERMAGLPVGVQVVGRRWEDEKVIEMMKVVDSALGLRNFGPKSWKRQIPAV